MDSSPLALAALALLGFVAIPTAALVILQRHHGARWAFAPEPGDDGTAGYRHGSAEERLRRAGRKPRVLPPRVIVVTTWMSFALGQMFVPGLIAGLYGLLAMGLGLISIPGLVLAILQFTPAVALYARDPGAPGKARAVSRYTIILNIIVVLTAFIVMPLASDIAPGVALMTLPYAALSFLHAHLLERSASALERSLEQHPREEACWPTSVPVAIQAGR